MRMKLPLTIIIIIAWALVTTSYIGIMAFKEVGVDAKLKMIGETKFHDTAMNVWKVGDCYVFGIAYENPEINGNVHTRPPVFFSNCGK